MSSSEQVLKDTQINITFSLGKSYYLEGNIRIIMASLPPSQMTLLVSRDNGVTFEPIEYYNADCSDLYAAGVASQVTKAVPWTVQCTQNYSAPVKYTGAEIMFFLKGRYNLFATNNVLNQQALYAALDMDPMYDFLTFTDIRIFLQKPGSDGGGGSSFGATQNLKSKFYSMSDFSAIAGYVYLSLC